MIVFYSFQVVDCSLSISYKFPQEFPSLILFQEKGAKSNLFTPDIFFCAYRTLNSLLRDEDISSYKKISIRFQERGLSNGYFRKKLIKPYIEIFSIFNVIIENLLYSKELTILENDLMLKQVNHFVYLKKEFIKRINTLQEHSLRELSNINYLEEEKFLALVIPLSLDHLLKYFFLLYLKISPINYFLYSHSL